MVLAGRRPRTVLGRLVPRRDPVRPSGLPPHSGCRGPRGVAGFLSPAHGGAVALFTGPPGATRQVASILWRGKVTPPPPCSGLTQTYHLKTRSRLLGHAI